MPVTIIGPKIKNEPRLFGMAVGYFKIHQIDFVYFHFVPLFNVFHKFESGFLFIAK